MDTKSVTGYDTLPNAVAALVFNTNQAELTPNAVAALLFIRYALRTRDQTMADSGICWISYYTPLQDNLANCVEAAGPST